MKKHLLGFGLFTLIVGATVFAAAYYFKMSKPIPEIPVVNLNTRENYSCKYKQENSGNSVVVDLEAKKIFTEMDLPIEMNKIDRYGYTIEIFAEGKNKAVFTGKDISQDEIILLYTKHFTKSFSDDLNKFSSSKSYYARMRFSAKDSNNRPIEISSENVPVTVFAGKQNY